jgi:hypothetical protein
VFDIGLAGVDDDICRCMQFNVVSRRKLKCRCSFAHATSEHAFEINNARRTQASRIHRVVRNNRSGRLSHYRRPCSRCRSVQPWPLDAVPSTLRQEAWSKLPPAGRVVDLPRQSVNQPSPTAVDDLRSSPISLQSHARYQPTLRAP